MCPGLVRERGPPGKLIGAGAYLARENDHGDAQKRIDARIEQLQKLGAPDDVIAGELERFQAEQERIDQYIVHPDNWPILLTFLSCSRALAVHGYIPATEIESDMRIRRIPRSEREEMLDGVRLIEQGYLENVKRASQTIRDSATHHR